jgi:uncharacterized protein HemY
MSRDDEPKPPDSSRPEPAAGSELQDAEADALQALDALDALRREPNQTPRPPESGPAPRSLPPNPEIARWLTQGMARPSFFPEESPDQSRAFVDDLMPSVPPVPTRGQPLAPDSGLYATAGMRTGEDGEDQEISTVVLLNTRDTSDSRREPRATASARPGLISSLLGQERVLADDEGAVAALRTLPKRKRRGASLPLVGRGSDAARARLLSDLGGRTGGARGARLHAAAAELFARNAEHEHARRAHADAFAADPTDSEALRRHLRDCIAAGDYARATDLLRAQAELPLAPEERALVLCQLAELEQSRNDDLAAAETAATEARRIHPGSLAAGLLLAELCAKSGRQRQAAEALRRTAELWRDSDGRGALLLMAARLLSHCGETAQAQALYARAAATTPGSFGALLGSYRSCRATGDVAAAERALQDLAQVTSDAPLRSELLRHRARLLHELLQEPGRAAIALDGETSLLGARKQARAAEAAGDMPRRTQALQAWAHQAGGMERALALFELARVHADGGAREAAEQSLHEAAQAGAPSGLLGLAREALARAAADSAGLARAIEAGEGSDALRAAAKLAAEPDQTAGELELLTRACDTQEGRATAQALALDAAAELADLGYLRSALARAAAGLAPHNRLGPWLAWLDLHGDDAALHDERNDVLQQLRQAGRATPIVLRELARASADAAAQAELWLEEAAHSAADHAAFAATMAGRYLERAGADPGEAYAEALDAVRGYWPACFALEVAARQRADLLGLERAHRELAATAAAGVERAARHTRLGLLCAEADPEAAARKLEQALEDRPTDLLLSDLLMRLCADGAQDLRAERLRRGAALEPDGRHRRAALLRAAAASEDAQDWNEAIELYAEVLGGRPDDAFAQRCLAQTLAHAGHDAELIAHVERALSAATTTSARCARLETLAALETRRGELGRARMALETLLEAQPGNLVALRGMEAIAMQEEDRPRLLAASAQLALALSGERERVAQLLLALRTDAQLAQGGADALLLSCESLIRSDLPYALALEALAIRTGDRTRFYEAARMVSELLTDPMESASYALRAAEAFEAAAPARAAEELGPALLAAPEHPLAIEELGRLYRAAGNAQAAAETFERAATLARSPKHAVPLWHCAAVIFHDELSDRPRAQACLQRVVEIDVLFGDAFARLRALLADKSDAQGLLELLERRLSTHAEPSLRCELHEKRARLFIELGQPEPAKAALHAALEADAMQPELLRTLAELCLADAQYRQAADALIQLARITTDAAVLAYAFYQLGVIYDEHLPDPRRAEIAFTRVVSLAPGDARPIERLVAIWRRSTQLERAVRALRHLVTSDQDTSQRETHLVMLAETLSEQGDARGAEQVLGEARQQTPASLPVLRALDALYERQGDREARAMHLTRSCHALRAAIEENPADVAAWSGLVELLSLRERQDAAIMAANAARAIGHDAPQLVARCAALPGLGAEALRDGVLRKIQLRGVLDATRNLLQATRPQLDELLPTDPSLQTTTFATRFQVVAAAAALFGLPPPVLRSSAEPVCLPVADKPLTLLVSGERFERADDAQRFFLVTRALAIAQQGLTLLVRAAPERLLLLVHAARRLLNPGYAVAAVDHEALVQLTRELDTALPATTKSQLGALLLDVFAEGEWNPRRVAAQALTLGSRLALCVTGNVQAAVDALLLLKGRDPNAVEATERQSLARTDPQLRALLSFAVSEAYLEARREVLGAGVGQGPS